MTIYILWFMNFDGGRDFIGVFSSRENAEAFAVQREDLRRQGATEIDEEVVDAP